MQAQSIVEYFRAQFNRAFLYNNDSIEKGRSQAKGAGGKGGMKKVKKSKKR